MLRFLRIQSRQTLVSFLTIASSTVFADTDINITNLDSDSFQSNVGIAGSVVSTTSGNSNYVTYTLNNLDLAEDGTANDAITFTIEVAGCGGTISTISGTGGQPWGVNGIGSGAIHHEEGINFSLLSSNVTLGDPGSNAGLAFVGFTGVNTWYTNGDLPRLSDVHTTVSGEDFGTSLKLGASNVSNTFSSNTESFFVRNEQTDGNGFFLGNLSLSFKASPLTTLSGFISQFEDHLNNTTTLTASQLQTLSTNIRNHIETVGTHDSILSQAIDAVELYESVRGNLFSGGQFNRDTYNNVNNALRQVAVDIHQGLIDYGWTHENVQRYQSTLTNKKFLLADYFPRSVAPPADPNASYQVQINADVPVQFGFPHQFKFDEARRPTGAYLAPGSVAQVTVPDALVNKGYLIRVNAHVFDLSIKSFYKRLDRVSLTFPITSQVTEIAHPLGGAIYIEVPYGSEDGLQTITFQNTVRSPFYSNTVARQTSNQEWLDTERHHPGPWADFETDKFMMNVPSDWISNWDHAEAIIGQWDDACAVIDRLFGYEEPLSKTTLYLQVDVVIRAKAFSTGYPQSNSSFNPLTFAGGLSTHEFLNGPKFAGSEHLHELGHAEYFTKFGGEVEAAVNLPYVAVHYQNHGVSIDESLGRSVGDYSRRLWSREQSAIHWMVTEAFRSGVWNMTSQQSQYQQRGYADYVDLAHMFGWEALHRFWRGDHIDYENGISRVGFRNYDPSYDRIQRMSTAAGVDLNPLMHFWGNAAGNHNDMQTWMDANNIPDSRLIYDRLRHYQSKIPNNVAEFTAHRNIFYSHLNANDKAYYDTMTAVDGWGQEEHDEADANMEYIINRFFPNGRPKINTYPHVATFDINYSEWGHQEDDDWDWRLHTGPTETVGSGPNTSPDGSQYLLLEGHDTGQGAQSSYMDCVFDMSALSGAELTFDYFMFGPYVDSLSVDVHDGTQWVTDVWIAQGSQQTSSDDDWDSATVSLSPFVGNTEVTVRFRGQKTYWNASDIALDNVVVSESTTSNTVLAQPQSLTTNSLLPLDLELTALAPEGTQVNYATATLPSNGTLTGTAPLLRYTPNSSFIGSDSFTFSASDGINPASTAAINITVLNPYQISWGAATNVSTANDVSTNGQLVEAYNLGGNTSGSLAVTDALVNGTLFQATTTILPNNFEVDSFSGDTGDADYNQLLSTFDYGGGTDTVSIAVGNGLLIPDDYYEIQAWYTDTRFPSRVTPVGDGSGNTVSLSAAGQFAIGTFFASSTTQTLTLDSPDFGQAHLNAYQIRSLSIAPTAFELWAETAFAGASGAIDISETGNPDGDNFTNLEEWVLMLNPMITDRPELAINQSETTFSIQYQQRNVGSPYVRAAWSKDLINWHYHGESIDGESLTETLLETNANIESMSASVPMGSDYKFIRLEVWSD